MKNLKLILIIFLALFLRINYDTFVPGYNFDELAMVSTAIQSFPFGIIKTAATNDYHAPLYQLIIHFFTYFNSEWLYIRLFNIILSVINIFVFYKIGCLVKNKNCGYILALIFTVNHLVISTCSFVKFYCFLFLLISINLYYLIKILKYDKGYFKFAFVNAAIILTSTYGFIFVFLEYLYLFIINRNKNLYKSALISTGAFILYLPMLLNQIKLNFANLFSPHGYYADFSLLSFYNVINDYFSPLLNYCCNLAIIQPHILLVHFATSAKYGYTQYSYLLQFITFSLIPVLIAIYFLYFAFRKNDMARKIGTVALLFLIVFIIMTKLELTGFIPIYMYPFGIILLICLGMGIEEIFKNKTTVILFSTFIILNLFISNVYAPKNRNFVAAKIFYAYEEFYKTHDNPYMIVTTGGRFLKKYYKNKNILDFDYEKIRGNFGKEFIGLVFGADIPEKINKNNAKEILLPLILKKYRSPDFEKYFVENVYKKLKKGEEVVFSMQNDLDLPFIEKYEDYTYWLTNNEYCPHLVKMSVKNSMPGVENCIDTSTMTHAIESYSYEYLIDLLEKYFTRVKIEEYRKTDYDDWKKTFEDTSNKYSTLFLAQNGNKSWIFATYKKQ